MDSLCYRNAKLLAAVIFGLPGSALAQTIVPGGSDISIPTQLDDMAVQSSTRPGLFGDLATGYRYQNTDDLIEVNVFRASYPSASLWFTQAVRRTEQLFAQSGLTPIGNPEPFLASSDKPNGMRSLYQVGPPFVSTSIAVVSFGPWLVSVHSTSKSLDVEQQRKRLDQLLAQIGPPKPVKTVYPLTTPAMCDASKRPAYGRYGELPFQKVTFEMKPIGGFAAAIASGDSVAASDGGVAAQPDAYCRRQSESGKTLWYETKEDAEISRWILPISETGITIEGIAVPLPDEQGNVKMIGTVLTNDLSQSSVRGFYTMWPDPVSAQAHALAAFAQGATPYAAVKYGTRNVEIQP